MTKCPNCQSENGKEGTREIHDKKVGIWKCLNCNGEHKISLKPQATEDSHASSTATSTPKTIGDGTVSNQPKPETSKHEKTERPATRDHGTDPERTDRQTA